MSEALSLPVLDACWARIGVRGDCSCSELSKVIHCHNCAVFARAASTLLDRPGSKDYLAELSKLVAEPAAPRRASNRSVLLFQVAQERYAIESHAVLEVTDVPKPRPVPHRSNAVFHGLVNIQGRLELCISLSGLLGVHTEAHAAEHMRVLVVADEGRRWVFPVDVVGGVQRFDAATLLRAPASSSLRPSVYVVGLFTHEAHSYGLLDLKRVCEDVQASLR